MASSKLYRPARIYVEEAARNFALTERVLQHFAEIQPAYVPDPRAAIDALRREADPVGAGKRTLYLAYDRGRSFKPFPESENYLSCDYYTLHLAEGCDLECSYCILQSYLTNPMLTLYVNVEEMLARLAATLEANQDRFFRIGTGQLADSLSLDPIAGHTALLVPFFAGQKNAVLELKTKSTHIDALLALDPKGRTLVSWSINSRKIQQEEEHKCASIDERLEAAVRVAGAGYRLGFHLDPIIDYPGWEKDYEEVIDSLFDRIPAERIAWISLGCLRMMPSLKPVMQDRFPRSPLGSAEWARGMDGKLRYFRPRRIEIYRAVTTMIRRRSPETTLYLSMETPEIWRQVFGWEPDRAAVCRLLDAAVTR